MKEKTILFNEMMATLLFGGFVFCLSLMVGTLWQWLVNPKIGIIMGLMVVFGMFYLKFKEFV